MFGMGFTEILMIAVVAILFLGPDKLPDAMVKIAKFVRGAKNALTEAKSAIDSEIKISELKEEALGYKAKLDAASSELQGFKNLNSVDALNESLDGITSTTKQVEPKQDEDMVIKKRKDSTKEDNK
jgi:sec-independent protein translocase protein TatB